MNPKPYDTGHPRPPPTRPAPMRREAGQRPAGRVRRIKPVTGAIARWAGGFLVAGWRLDEVARLFDVEPEDLGDWMGVEA